MKNTTAILLLVGALVIIGSFLYSNTEAAEFNNEVLGEGSPSQGEIQKVNIGTKNYNYWPNEITVKANQPVEITLDETVYGCFRAFTIKEFGVSKYSKNPDDKIIFTPNKKGKFTFSCSMGMGYGVIKIV